MTNNYLAQLTSALSPIKGISYAPRNNLVHSTQIELNLDEDPESGFDSGSKEKEIKNNELQKEQVQKLENGEWEIIKDDLNFKIQSLMEEKIKLANSNSQLQQKCSRNQIWSTRKLRIQQRRNEVLLEQVEELKEKSNKEDSVKQIEIEKLKNEIDQLRKTTENKAEDKQKQLIKNDFFKGAFSATVALACFKIFQRL